MGSRQFIWGPIGAQIRSMLIASGLCLFAIPAAAQDYDPGMAAHDAMSQTQFVTQQSAIGNHMLRESVRRNQRRADDDRNVQTCANGDRMRKQGRRSAALTRLLRLCRQAGY